MQILCVLPFSLVIQYLLWSLLIAFSFGCFQATPNGSQGLLLAQYQGSLGGMLLGIGIEPNWLYARQAAVLPAILSL